MKKGHSKASTTWLTLLIMIAVLPAVGQPTQPTAFPVVIGNHIIKCASDYSEVKFDRSKLDLSSLSSAPEAKEILTKLNGIYIRTYEFDSPGEYTAGDLMQIRSQLAKAEWDPMVEWHSLKGNDDSEIYMRTVNREAKGMFLLNTKPREISLIYIDGSIVPSDLAYLSGKFGIPGDLIAVEKIAPFAPPNPLLRYARAVTKEGYLKSE